MAEGYDVQLFNQLYKDTEGLRKKLASGIDCRRFGLPYDEVLSFFDVKFIYTFNKYHDEPANILKAQIIKSLQNFKQRILRKAYTVKHSQNIVSVETLLTYDENLIEEHPENDPRDYYYNTIMKFMEGHLSENAFLIFQVQLNPPPFVLKRINPGEDKDLQKIPDEVLLEYFDLGFTEKSYKYLTHLKKEIRNAIAYAKVKFKAS